jgi:erythromycin esterase-like protein
MAETLDALVQHLGRSGAHPKIAVWEHNSHLGDARATDMGRRGELNVGQLTREKYGPDAVLVGFTTYHGTVTAASDWGKPAERKRVRPGAAATKRCSMQRNAVVFSSFGMNMTCWPNACAPLGSSGPSE